MEERGGIAEETGEDGQREEGELEERSGERERGIGGSIIHQITASVYCCGYVYYRRVG